ncbi:hypothetical protein ACFVIN_33910, partial [Streptomyces prasinus]
VAYLSAPGRGARGVHTPAGGGGAAAGPVLRRAGVRTGSTGRLLADHQAWTTGGAFAAGALVLLLWNHPTVGAVALVVGVVLAVLAVLAFLAAAAPRAPGEAGP